MSVNSEFYITIPITVLSGLITIINLIILIYLILCFFFHKYQTIKIGNYFKYSALITVIFNFLNGLFNFIYCLHLILLPYYNDNFNDYVHHPSHIQRIISTVCWYFGKTSLIFFFSGRLYYAFNDTLFQLSFKYFVFLNIFNLIFTPLSIIIGYLYVYNHNKILTEISFNLFRLVYQFETFFILFIFSKRLLYLEKTEHIHSFADKSNDKPNDNDHNHNKQESTNFLKVATKNTVLSGIISITVFFTTFCCFGFRFIFGKQTRLTLLIPMNMGAVDAAITSICVLCFFSFGNGVYSVLCSKSNNLCNKICYYLSTKYHIHSMDSIMNLKSNPNQNLRDVKVPHNTPRNSVQLQHINDLIPPGLSINIDNIINKIDNINPRKSKLFELKVIKSMTPRGENQSTSPLKRYDDISEIKSKSAFLSFPSKGSIGTPNEIFINDIDEMHDMEIIKETISNFSLSEPITINDENLKTKQMYKHSKRHSIS